MSGASAIEGEQARVYSRLFPAFGFVPNLFRVQSDLPRTVEAEACLIEAILGSGKRVKRSYGSVLHAAAQVRGSEYCRALFPLVKGDEALVGFAVKLARYGPWFSANDIEEFRSAGFNDRETLRAIAATALGQMLCTLDSGLRPGLDSELRPAASVPLPEVPAPAGPAPQAGPPHLSAETTVAPPSGFPPYAVLREHLGFVPGLFKMQAASPELLDAEVRALELVLFPEDHLSRVQKEFILLTLATANFNSYLVALHGQVLESLGVSRKDSDQIVADHSRADISGADKTLLSEMRKLACSPGESAAGFDTQVLLGQGFTEAQIVEAVAMSGLTNFLSSLQFGLGAVPDFPVRRAMAPPPAPGSAKDLYPSASDARPTSDAPALDDPDAGLVARVQQGETAVFEDLVRRHTRRIFGTLHGILGDHDQARDATQDAFLKAFEHIGKFEGRSKFSTWLTSIAVNTGTEILRQRKPLEQLDTESYETFRPRQVQRWAEDPERLFAASQVNALVRDAVRRLPQKYRVAVLLRDINQLTTEEAAEALGLSVPALKARVLRGRLMLRESLASHFTCPERTDV
jgi:RNA polymerase sigma-70 factor, ECF subfamily